ncbi:esterase [Virgibacillus sp. W0181]|uniref:esterase n=1 Tax=Virgibacillus sp. W0181 TaxID=3391581 RepID=UPI003F4783AD
MIGVNAEKINDIPCLIVVKQKKEDQALPTILYCHGYTSAKEHNLPIAYLLAQKGFRVILPDSMYHGERYSNLSSSALELSFWDIVLQNIKEVGDIKKVLDQRNLISANRFGLAGTSMGGITTSGALTQYTWIKTAVILMGTPKITYYAEQLVDEYKDKLPISVTELDQLYEELSAYDLSKQLSKLNDRPLMLWHGEKDQVIPFEQAQDFFDEAVQTYKNKEAIHFISEKNRDHKISRMAILETVKWFEKHL